MKLLKAFAIGLMLCATLSVSEGGFYQEAQAATAQEIQVRAQDALTDLRQKMPGVNQVLQNAKGLLIFPHVYQGGFVFGGEYGEGVLLVNGQPVDYYNIISASWGLQAGAQRKSVIIAFMTDDALRNFRDSAGWEIGGDATIAVVNVGAEGSIDLTRLNKPVLVMVTDQRGLMGGVSLEGSKVNRINR